MIIVKIKQGEETRQIGSMPQTTGLKKAILRYGIDAMQAAIREKEILESELDPNSAESLQQYCDLYATVEKLYDTKISLIIRAFGGQLTVDDIEDLPDEENDRIIAQLQLEARGVSPKNAQTGAAET